MIFSYNIINNPVHIHDFHATLLPAILRKVVATGYSGPLSVELFLQQFAAADPFAMATEIKEGRGAGEHADHIVGGAEHSTLSHDAFPAQEFDFMLANPPYGKSWKKDLELMGGKEGMRDPRFKVMHCGEELSLVTRSSDGQMLFLANMLSKMKHDTPLGSRIAEVHNGSSLFTGDAGGGAAPAGCTV